MQLGLLYSAGGLVTAVAPAVVACKGLWIGWTGLHDLQESEKIPEANENDQSSAASLSSEQVQVCKYSFTTLKKPYIYCQSYSLLDMFI